MSLKRLLLSALVLASLAAPSRAEDVAPGVRFSESYGPMTPRYARELDGLSPTTLDRELQAWRERLLTLRNLKDVQLTRRDDRIEVTLTEAPYVLVVPKLIPFVLPVGVELVAEDWRLGGQYYDIKAWAGYVWSGVTLYEPHRVDPALRGNLAYNFPEAYARAGVMVLPYTRVYLEGKAAGSDMTGNTAIASEYGTVGGSMITLSPFLRFDDTDHPDMPRQGTRVRAGVLFGPKAFGNPGDYLRYDGAFQEYIPFGKYDSLAIGLHGGLGSGEIPLPQAYWLGAGNFLRGYTGSRFVGNQMLALSVELRHALWPSIFGSGLTLWSTGFVDAARSWNHGGTIAFPQDIRPSVGGYLGLSFGSWYIGRLEAAVGNEGPFVNIAAGLPFPW
ncbi:Surface antigen [compost metagenome]